MHMGDWSWRFELNRDYAGPGLSQLA